ncbi:hypothetical protein M1545_03690 [Patescibacteria group bacterium]|nr:hypothetical protein [Patescibacteria group bacterium]
MKRMKFGEGLLERKLQGLEKNTIRKWREAYDFKKGEIFIGEFPELGGVELLLMATEDTIKKTFLEITPQEALDNGYENLEALLADFKKNFYKDLTGNMEAAVIYFDFVKFDGYPTFGKSNS